ncbi:hypothetical protein SH601_11560 [Gracilibacillus sp. S3-1-1]|uniref:Uncharacterized protein n=1 Tax=Gracilibacillus pellucidus TaxID=3095368 RepID=A0ACC6M6Q3_9BACI|nr:hypothetical protein [Gracilibacillus sp. S3-1-1]MDX8046619.1 hypothetical protein [Gracilibacillus sp. S3-1-1]
MKLLSPLIILVLTAMLVFDYFPALSDIVPIPIGVFIFIVIALIVINVIFNKNIEHTYNEKKSLKSNLLLTGYFIVLMVVLTLLGGKSVTGISLDNGILWMLILFSVVNTILRWRRATRESTSAN